MSSKMLKLIIFVGLLTTFLVTVSCKEAPISSESESCDEDDGDINQQASKSSESNSCDEDDGDTNQPPKCRKNEVYSTCIQGECRALNCSQLGQPLACASVDADSCKKGCICAQGYVRDKKGKCIPQDTCPEGCGGDPNAKTGCSNYCRHSCSDYNEPGGACALFCIVNGCACKDNYVYDSSSNKCVLPKDCPPKCPKNEVYSTCIQGECRALNCSQLGQPLACASVDADSCKKGCICAQGYVRDKKGKCIPQDTCPEGCGGDPNAKTGCNNYCGDSCLDYNKTDVICTDICTLNGCSCKDNYVYDSTSKKCVLPKDCNVGCGGDPNAVSGCAGYCGTKCTTSNWNAQQRKLLCVHACIKGCKCISGYLYDEKVKKCVPPEDCS